MQVLATQAQPVSATATLDAQVRGGVCVCVCVEGGGLCDSVTMRWCARYIMVVSLTVCCSDLGMATLPQQPVRLCCCAIQRETIATT